MQYYALPPPDLLIPTGLRLLDVDLGSRGWKYEEDIKVEENRGK